MGVTISLAQTVEGAGVMCIARTAFADHSQTGAVGSYWSKRNTTTSSGQEMPTSEMELRKASLPMAQYDEIEIAPDRECDSAERSSSDDDVAAGATETPIRMRICHRKAIEKSCCVMRHCCFGRSSFRQGSSYAVVSCIARRANSYLFHHGVHLCGLAVFCSFSNLVA